MIETTRAWARVPFGDASLVGDPERHLNREQLARSFERIERTFALHAASLASIVVRRSDGGRDQPATAELSSTGGLVGDRWAMGNAQPGDQVSLMNVEVAARIANGQSVALFGDNLFTDLDVRESALPEGARLRIGGAVLQLSLIHI